MWSRGNFCYHLSAEFCFTLETCLKGLIKGAPLNNASDSVRGGRSTRGKTAGSGVQKPIRTKTTRGLNAIRVGNGAAGAMRRARGARGARPQRPAKVLRKKMPGLSRAWLTTCVNLASASPWQSYGKGASGDEVCGNGNREPSARETCAAGPATSTRNHCSTVITFAPRSSSGGIMGPNLEVMPNSGKLRISTSEANRQNVGQHTF
jgi:hypothetical protein